MRTSRLGWRQRMPLLAVLLVLAMTLAGCGLLGDQDGEGKATPAPTEQVATFPGAPAGGAGNGSAAANRGNAAATGTPAAGQGSAQDAEAGTLATSGSAASGQAQPEFLPGTGNQQGAGQSTAAQPSLGDFSSAVRNVSDRVRPAVVHITNEQVQLSQFGQVTVPAGVGSGVIYDPSGLVITNNHVIAGAENLIVALPDGRTFGADLLGADPRNDLAVLRLQNAQDLPVAELGNSDDLQVGDWVVAIGNALGLPGGPTVTAGVVSALGRTVQEPGENGGPGPYLFDVIQTSAPINPGNSGGALVDLNGRVIGINTLVAGSAGDGIQAQGIGFAISMNTARGIAEQLATNGRVQHPTMGVSYVPVTPGVAAQLGIDQKFGVVVMGVVPRSGAAKAGLKEGDVIVSVDGEELREESTLARIISSHKPGDTLTLSVLREGQTSDVQVTLGEAE